MSVAIKRERPILLYPEEVCAILRNGKTQLRRVMIPQPPVEAIEIAMSDCGGYWRDFPSETQDWPCPYGKPGDLLRAQEAYAITDTSHPWPRTVSGRYLADDTPFEIKLTAKEWGKWRSRKFPYRPSPGRFMYRSLARIFLEVVAVRGERVQDITEEDAIASGYVASVGNPDRIVCGTAIDMNPTAREKFRVAWDSRNAKRGFGWNENPWVWVGEFKRHVGSEV